MNLDLRLSVPVACAWVVAALLIGIPQYGLVVAVVLWLAAGALTAAVLGSGRQQLSSIALACALAALCSSAVALSLEARHPAVLDSLAERHAQVEVQGTTTSPMRADVDFFGAQLSAVVVDGETFPLSSPALVFRDGGRFDDPSENAPTADGEAEAEADDEWGIGVKFAVTATLTTTPPGDGRAVLVFATEQPQWRADPEWMLEWANDLRRTFALAAESLPGAGGELIGGLAIGDTGAVSEEMDDAMKTSALSHLTAVSGANCAIVVGLIMALGGRLGAHRVLRIAVSVAVLVAFVVVVTPDPSVLRAAVMATLVLIALGRGRPVRGMAVLSLATIGLLVFDPWLARNFAFVLSVFATAGLLLFAEPLAQLLHRWLPRWLALVIAVPLAAQLACQPVLLLLQPTLPTYGVVANVLAAPAAPIATVVGLAACVALSIFPVLGIGLLWIAWVPSSWVAAVATFFADAPGARIPWWEGWVGVLLLSVLTVSLLAALVMKRVWRRRALTMLVVVATLVGAASAGLAIRESLSWPGEWQFAQCDVGQGDAVVVRSGSQVALIDAGPDPDLLEACLSRLGIGDIDLLVLTHFDHDHVGGAEALVGRTDTVLVGPSGSDQDQALIDSFAAAGARVIPARTGDRGELGDLRWNVLWPGARLAGIDPGNDASVVVEFVPRLRCTAQCLSSLFLGDLGQDAQARLMGEGTLARVDVVKVSHHGSADQYPPLYASLNATVGLIGVGVDNGYGHPTAETLAMLEEAGVGAVRSDTAGLVLVSRLEGSEAVSVWSQRHVSGQR